MPDLLEDFETYFKNNEVTDTIFRDTMLDSPDEAIAVYEYGGASGLNQVASVDRSVQIVARSKSATTAKERARKLYATLVTEDGILNLTELRWTLLNIRQVPFKMKVDEAGRTYYCFNVGVTTYND